MEVLPQEGDCSLKEEIKTGEIIQSVYKTVEDQVYRNGSKTSPENLISWTGEKNTQNTTVIILM